jgi:diguanylate cyclase
MMGMTKSQMIGRNATSIMPDIHKLKFGWLDIYGKVAATGESIRFEQYYEPWKGWYEVTVFSTSPGLFGTLFREITKGVEENEALKAIITVSEQSFHFPSHTIDYELLADTALKISGAKFVGFNLYNETGNQFTTVAISGVRKSVLKAAALIGFNPIGKKWDHDPVRAARIEASEITLFQKLSQLTGEVLPFHLIESLERLFKIENVYVAKIMKDGRMLGDFTFMMPKGKGIRNSEYIQIFTGITGQYLERKKIEDLLIKTTGELEDFFNIALDLLCIADTNGNFVKINRSWCDILGYTVEELEKRKFLDFVHPDDIPETLKKLSLLEKQEKVLNFANRYRAKDGSYKHIEWRSYPKGKLIYAAARDISHRIMIETQLKDSNEQFKLAVQGSNDGIWDWDLRSNELYISPKWKEQLGYSDEEIRNEYASFERLLHPDDLQKVSDTTNAYFLRRLSSYDVEFRMLHKDGTYRWIRSRGEAIRDKHNKAFRMAGSHTDITERKALEEQLFNEKEQFRTILLSVGDGVIATDEQGIILVMNRIAEELTGWSNEKARGRKLDEVYRVVYEENLKLRDSPVTRILSTVNMPSLSGDTLLVHRSGSTIYIEDSAAPIKNMKGEITGIVIVFRDFTEKREKQKQVEYLSFHDPMTGLYNRRYMEEELNTMDTSNNYPLSVIIIDVNGLKLVNDRYGHDRGDQLIIGVADIIKRVCKTNGLAARTGGDEFIIMLPKTSESQTKTIEKKIHTMASSTPLESVNISLAVGYAIKTDASQNIREIIKEADNNMYRSKPYRLNRRESGRTNDYGK